VIRVLRYESGSSTATEVDLDQAVVEAGHSLLWFDCDEPEPGELDALGRRLGVNEFVLEDLRTSGQRTKLDHYSDHFHVAVHDCELPGTDLLTREIDVVFGEGWLLSVPQPPEDRDARGGGRFPMETVQQRFEAQCVQHDSADEGLLLWALLDVVVDRYFVVTDAVDDNLDAVEADVLDDAGDSNASMRSARPRQLFDLSKTIVEFRRNAMPLREVVAAILRRESTSVSDAALVHFQDLGDHVLRVAELLESQRDVLTNLRDAELAVISNRMNRSMQQLAAWGAILIVSTLITGILGMNFKNAPELDWGEGFLLVGGIMVVVSMPMFAYFRRKRWL
jgi:magnesium transporter